LRLHECNMEFIIPVSNQKKRVILQIFLLHFENASLLTLFWWKHFFFFERPLIVRFRFSYVKYILHHISHYTSHPLHILHTWHIHHTQITHLLSSLLQGGVCHSQNYPVECPMVMSLTVDVVRRTADETVTRANFNPGAVNDTQRKINGSSSVVHNTITKYGVGLSTA